MKNKKTIVKKTPVKKVVVKKTPVKKTPVKKVPAKKASELIAELETIAKKQKKNKDNREVLQRFFKTGKGQYGEGDVFLGVNVPDVRRLAKKYQDVTNVEVKRLLMNKAHEVRLAGLLILVAKYEKAKTRDEKRVLVGFYLEHSSRVNNWDLVDLSVYKILGDFLLEEAPKKAQAVLNKLASSKNMWERRMAMVSTFSFIKAGRKEEVFIIAKKLMKDGEDLIHKASGWMLREAGKRIGEKELKEFLDMNHKEMPRTALRYAIEKLDEAKKKYYMKLKDMIK